MAKPWFKCISPDHPIAIEVVDEFGPEGFYYLCRLLDLYSQIGNFELTPQILKQHCKLNSQKVGRIFQKIAEKLEESIKILEKSSKKVPTLTPSNPVPDSTLIEKNRIERVEKNRKSPVFSEQDLSTAEFIFAGVKRHDPKAKEPNLKAWAEEIRLMRERDNRTDDEIRAVFTWANTDDFWKKNILSPRKLREKFTQLTIAKQQRAPSRSIPGNAIVPAEQRTAGVLEF